MFDLRRRTHKICGTMRWAWALSLLMTVAAFVAHGMAHGQPWEPAVTFGLSAAGIIPLARLIGIATENLSERAGPTWGGLLNATFGNACELILGVVGLSKGLAHVVKASLTGSILGNLLLVAGLTMVAGGWKRERQRFSLESAQASAGLLAVAVAAMLFPAIFHFSFAGVDPKLEQHQHNLSIGTSVILLLVYAAGLWFTLTTKSHVFSAAPPRTDEDPAGFGALGHRWTWGGSILVLGLCSIIVAGLSELLAGEVEPMARQLHWNSVFVGVVVIAVIGNAAEHATAIYLARRNDMETAMTIIYQSSLQIALFATPILILVSALMSHLGSWHVPRMDLVFSPLEVAAVLLSVGIVIIIGQNGETNWFEGVLLLGVYAILCVTFFYIPVTDESASPGGETATPLHDIAVR